MSWQLIDTVPKDGFTRVLLAMPTGYIRGLKPATDIRVDIGLWNPTSNDAHSPWYVDARQQLAHEDPPTHWMPLPEPPRLVK